jgi:ubiquinone/menaquinone biosynthesis C-methylase UbiE
MYGKDGPSLLELMQQALSSTDHGYDLLASKFDATPFRTPDAILEAVRLRLLRDPRPERALDVCCGTGAATRTIGSLATQGAVGVDRSEGMLAEAARRQTRVQGPPTRYARADALALPFAGSFDLAFSFGAFGHIRTRDQAAFLNSVRRALRVGGRFVFVTSTMPPVSSRTWWLARGFNAAMRVRNAVIKPEFVMYYLTFLMPEVAGVLDAAGFDVVHERLDVTVPSLSPELRDLTLVMATRRV